MKTIESIKIQFGGDSYLYTVNIQYDSHRTQREKYQPRTRTSLANNSTVLERYRHSVG